MAREVLQTHDADFCSRPLGSPGAKKILYGYLDLAFAPHSDFRTEMKKLFSFELMKVKRDQTLWTARVNEMNKMINNFADWDQHFQLIPFSSGRRICPGIAMGSVTMTYVLANLLHCFDWEFPKGVRKEDVCMEEEGGLTMHKKTPLIVVPTRVSSLS